MAAADQHAVQLAQAVQRRQLAVEAAVVLPAGAGVQQRLANDLVPRPLGRILTVLQRAQPCALSLKYIEGVAWWEGASRALGSEVEQGHSVGLQPSSRSAVHCCSQPHQVDKPHGCAGLVPSLAAGYNGRAQAASSCRAFAGGGGGSSGSAATAAPESQAMQGEWYSRVQLASKRLRGRNKRQGLRRTGAGAGKLGAAVCGA